MAKHTEKSAVDSLVRKGAKCQREDKVIFIPLHVKNTIGNGSMGIIDFLRKYCDRTVVFETKND